MRALFAYIDAQNAGAGEYLAHFQYTQIDKNCGDRMNSRTRISTTVLRNQRK